MGRTHRSGKASGEDFDAEQMRLAIVSSCGVVADF
jgi:hypothetical protein